MELRLYILKFLRAVTPYTNVFCLFLVLFLTDHVPVVSYLLSRIELRNSKYSLSDSKGLNFNSLYVDRTPLSYLIPVRLSTFRLSDRLFDSSVRRITHSADTSVTYFSRLFVPGYTV